jgi:hypothetical protein
MRRADLSAPSQKDTINDLAGLSKSAELSEAFQLIDWGTLFSSRSIFICMVDCGMMDKVDNKSTIFAIIP